MDAYREIGDLKHLKESVYLGDGAYATFDGCDYVITANHHELKNATDRVYIDFEGMRKLEEFTRKINQKIIDEACK